MKLEGKVAIITGSSRGIGACIARRYGAEGARVAVVAHTKLDKAEAVAKEKGYSLVVRAEVVVFSSGADITDERVRFPKGMLHEIIKSAPLDEALLAFMAERKAAFPDSKF